MSRILNSHGGGEPLGHRNGKRGRRAIVRLRHALACEMFIRWAVAHAALPPVEFESRPWRTPEWHVWHARGCP